MNETTSISALALLALLLAVPVLCICLGVAGTTLSPSLGPTRLVKIGLGTIGAYVLLIVLYIVAVDPRQSGIVTQGVSPGGRQYCVVQTYKGLIEPYQVGFYIRDPAGTWVHTTLAHQDYAWHAAGVTFSNGAAHISRDGELFRHVPVPTNAVDVAELLPGYRFDYCPSNFTPEDLLLFHNKRFKH